MRWLLRLLLSRVPGVAAAAAWAWVPRAIISFAGWVRLLNMEPGLLPRQYTGPSVELRLPGSTVVPSWCGASFLPMTLLAKGGRMTHRGGRGVPYLVASLSGVAGP